MPKHEDGEGIYSDLFVLFLILMHVVKLCLE